MCYSVKDVLLLCAMVMKLTCYCVHAGQTVSMELSAPRDLAFSSVTVQYGGQLRFVSHHGNVSDQWSVTVSILIY